MLTKSEWALRLASQYGFKVFPLRPNSKHPLFAGWKEAATRDTRQINAWWAAHPEANIGILCDGIVAIDIDVKNGVNGWDAWANKTGSYSLKLDARHAAVEFLTPSGGTHLIYLDPDNLAGNYVSKIGPGLDVRGGGNGYIVAPGSVIDNLSYQIVSDRDSFINPMPNWLREWFIDNRRAEIVKQEVAAGLHDPAWATEYAIREAECEWVENRLAEHGTRNQTAYTRALRLWELGVPLPDAVEILTWFLDQGAVPDEGAKTCAETMVARIYGEGAAGKHGIFRSSLPCADAARV